MFHKPRQTGKSYAAEMYRKAIVKHQGGTWKFHEPGIWIYVPPANWRMLVSRNKREGWYAGRRNDSYFFGGSKVRTKHEAYALKSFGRPTKPEE
jgi:hypothetical protein